VIAIVLCRNAAGPHWGVSDALTANNGDLQK